ncbi:uncharacterized protein LOC109949664 [Prunus persica]|uniref:uncharacterized protein LOC109949664 n=1 Tax=Prunus persica TaxID=3760 RepID=UPI0009AB5388|nr:uncharacterized protein LOC109949664 [Prunus persica]
MAEKPESLKFEILLRWTLTQEASQPDATNPIPDPPKGTSLHDSIPVDLQQSSDEDEGQKKPTKKKLGWGQRKVWQKIPKADKERIEKHYLSTQPRDNFWAGLNDEKVTNHDLKDIVWDLELSQNVIEAYIQIEEDKIEPMQTESPQYMSTWTWVSIILKIQNCLNRQCTAVFEKYILTNCHSMISGLHAKLPRAILAQVPV